MLAWPFKMKDVTKCLEYKFNLFSNIKDGRKSEKKTSKIPENPGQLPSKNIKPTIISFYILIQKCALPENLSSWNYTIMSHNDNNNFPYSNSHLREI